MHVVGSHVRHTEWNLSRRAWRSLIFRTYNRSFTWIQKQCSLLKRCAAWPAVDWENDNQPKWQEFENVHLSPATASIWLVIPHLCIAIVNGKFKTCSNLNHKTDTALSLCSSHSFFLMYYKALEYPPLQKQNKLSFAPQWALLNN